MFVVVLSGGNWNDGAKDGLSAWNSNNALSNSNTTEVRWPAITVYCRIVTDCTFTTFTLIH